MVLDQAEERGVSSGLASPQHCWRISHPPIRGATCRGGGCFCPTVRGSPSLADETAQCPIALSGPLSAQSAREMSSMEGFFFAAEAESTTFFPSLVKQIVGLNRSLSSSLLYLIIALFDMHLGTSELTQT